MKRVFLGGSRKVSHLNESVRSRLDEIINRNMRVLIGDANGADKAMQRLLADRGYSNVVVYFVGRAPRNNVGGWATHNVPVPAGTRGFDFYSAKDRIMAEESECGLMLWDGESRGTMENVERLAALGKPVAVYVNPERRFMNVLSQDDLDRLVDASPSLARQGSHASSVDAQTALILP